MEFSVVIPTYNRAAVLESTLRALARQKTTLEAKGAFAFEVIVVDDGSRDDTARRVRSLEGEFPARLLYLHQQNRRQGAARNLGSRRAAGELLLFLGDDTAPDPDFLAQHLAAHREEPEPVTVIGYTPWAPRLEATRFMRYVGEQGWQFGFSLIEDPSDVPFNFLYTSNLSLPRELFLEVGGFDEEFQEYGWEDVELGWRLRRRGVRLIYRDSAVAHHDHPTTIASFVARQRRVGASAWTLYRKHPDLGGFLGLPDYRRYGWAERLRMTLLTWACRLTERRRWPDLSRYYPDLMSYHYCRGLKDGNGR